MKTVQVSLVALSLGYRGDVQVVIFLNWIYESEYKNQCLLKREALGTPPAIIFHFSLYNILKVFKLH